MGICNSAHFLLVILALQFMRAVEMKQVAEQDAERAKFVVMKAEQVGRGAVKGRKKVLSAVI